MINAGSSLWRYASMDDLDVAGAVGSIRDWLGDGERRYWERLPLGPRRTTWLAGRMLIKTLVSEELQRRHSPEQPPTTFPDIQVHSLDRWGRKSPPLATGNGVVPGWSLSVAHTDRGVLAALVTNTDRQVGVDLVDPATMAQGTSRWWLTAGEQSQWDVETPEARARLWALKEALYKACSRGERFVPQQISVLRSSAGNLDCRYAGRTVRLVDLQVFTVDDQIAAVAVADRDAAAQTVDGPARQFEPARYAEAHDRPQSRRAVCHSGTGSGREV
jgi:phosphopantetheinyl transferase